jgi:hypothetical protein
VWFRATVLFAKFWQLFLDGALKMPAWGGREKGFAGTLALFRFWRGLQHAGAGIQFSPPG